MQAKLEGGPLHGQTREVQGWAFEAPVVPASLVPSAKAISDEPIAIFDPELGRYRTKLIEFDSHRYERRSPIAEGEEMVTFVHTGSTPVRDELWRRVTECAS